MLLEQLESLRLSEHAEATILTAVARRLVRRTVELGEVIESEARELNDLSAQHPAVVKRLAEQWRAWANTHQVFPKPGNRNQTKK